MMITEKKVLHALILILVTVSVASYSYTVVEDVAVCGKRSDVTCNTLKHYQQNQTYFSRSNVEWIFAVGVHYLTEDLIFNKVENVTIRGEGNSTTIYCPTVTPRLCHLLFLESDNILIKNINFHFPKEFLPVVNFSINVSTSSEKQNIDELCFSKEFSASKFFDYTHCPQKRFLSFVSVSGLVIQNVTLGGYNTHWTIIKPSGRYYIDNVVFTDMGPASNLFNQEETNHHIVIFLSEAPRALHFQLSNGIFQGMHNYAVIKKQNIKLIGTAIHIIVGQDKCVQSWEADIVIEDMVFYNIPILQLTSVNKINRLNLVLQNITGTGGFTRNLTSVFPASFVGSAIRLHIEDSKFCKKNSTSFREKELRVVLLKVKVSNYTSKLGVGFLNIVTCDKNQLPPKVDVIIKDSEFKMNYGINFGSVLHAEYKCSESWPNVSVYKFSIINSSFCENSASAKERCWGMSRMSPYIIEKYPHTGKGQYCLARNTAAVSAKGTVHLSGFLKGTQVTFWQNIISSNDGTGLSLKNTEIYFIKPVISEDLQVKSRPSIARGNVISRNNAYTYGGGIYMTGHSKLMLGNSTNLIINYNSAQTGGGGIFSQDNCSLDSSETCPCFYQFVNDNGTKLTDAYLEDINTKVTMRDNKCFRSGSSIFASRINSCSLFANFSGVPTSNVFQHVFSHQISMKNKNKSLHSYPQRISECSYDQNGRVEYRSLKNKRVSLFPGQNLVLQLVVYADMNVTLQTTLYALTEREKYINDTLLPVFQFSHIQFLIEGCNSVVIKSSSFLSNLQGQTLYLQLMVPLYQNTPLEDYKVYYYEYIKLHIEKECPIGYLINGKQVCVCLKFLEMHNINCSLKDLTFAMEDSFWLGNDSFGNLLFSTDCPRIFCSRQRELTKYKYVNLENQNLQCSNGYVGMLCTQCPNGYGVGTGSKRVCSLCTFTGLWLLLLLLLAGPFIVFITCCLNLTISTRSINGALFYFSILSINYDIIPRVDSDPTQSLVHLFTFKIPSSVACIHPVVDNFTQELFSLVFPLYLLGIVGSAFFLPKMRCINIHKVHMTVGPRITPVLVTMIGFAYIQMSEFVINSLAYTNLCNCTTKTCTNVWRYDASMEYFASPKHWVLALIALLLLMFFLIPITLTAIFGDLLRMCIRKQWYWNFIDTFYCSFKFRFGFWIGIRLLFRNILIIAKIFLPFRQTFLLTICIAFFIIIFQTVFRPFRHLRFERCLPRRLKKKYFTEEFSKFIANMIDNIFMINIAIVFTILLYETFQTEWMVIMCNTVSIGLFMLIITYHIFEYSPLRIPLIRLFIWLNHKYQQLRLNKKQHGDNRELQYLPNHEDLPVINLVLNPLDGQCDSSEESESDPEIKCSQRVGETEGRLTTPLLQNHNVSQ